MLRIVLANTSALTVSARRVQLHPLTHYSSIISSKPSVLTQCRQQCVAHEHTSQRRPLTTFQPIYVRPTLGPGEKKRENI